MRTTSRIPRPVGSNALKKGSKQNVAKERNPTRFKFPFLKLPSELRELIYHYALEDPDSLVFLTRDLHVFHQSKHIDNKVNLAPQLLQICKQVYAEAAPWIYYNNTFEFRNSQAATGFFDDYPSGAKLIRNIRINHQWWSLCTFFHELSLFESLERCHVDVWVGSPCPGYFLCEVLPAAQDWLKTDGTNKYTVLNICTVSLISYNRTIGAYEKTDLQQVREMLKGLY
ncbi:hypothetical protein BU23DRAFT_573052 [Bimuria novae-zelandiae CBS 107.79]|uniref:2EXR domain-containing protein n=1 Tax=Bimuria novae-zelandiae CBS 107.79 TaxID=1447943 RepID=A0A6A5UUC7_9PLEO|nr:hypothetical protein BU23DRAFT_573052 [Bimuria novae-zelandiae CBS 107.79]